MSFVEPLMQDLEKMVLQDLSPQARREAIALAAIVTYSVVQMTNAAILGLMPRHRTIIDDRETKGLSLTPPTMHELIRVRPDGHIAFEFELLEDVFGTIADLLEKHSPVGRSGRYRASHLFLADGVPADPRKPVAGAKEYVFVNAQPYARKIERGISNQADGVYQGVATLAAQRFGNLANIGFGYRPLDSGAVDAWASGSGLTRPRRRMSEPVRAEWLRRQPAIVITVR